MANDTGVEIELFNGASWENINTILPQCIQELIVIHEISWLTIEVAREWDEKQCRTDTLQYQVFTNKNGSCLPARMIEEACVNAVASIKEKQAHQ
jgi:hypothetical protein